MGSYRLEIASSARAGCQNKECKDAKVKIQKGELRVGSWVDSERFQSFFWRHWGCVTPKVISNLNETVEEESNNKDDKDYTALDGYDELPAEFQEKVRGALQQGHVDDADWKGDVEMNRPGKNGFRSRKKKADAAVENDAAEEKEEAPKSKKRGRAAEPKKAAKAQDEDEDEKETPAKKPKKGTRAKQPVKEESESDDAHEDEDEEEAPEPKKPAKRGRPAKASSTETKPATRATRQRKSTTNEDKAETEPVEEKPKRGRKKSSA